MINENARTKAILSNLKEFIKHVKKEELRKKNEKKTANAIIISSRDERDEWERQDDHDQDRNRDRDDWGRDERGKSNADFIKKSLFSHICHMCKKKGHWIIDCLKFDLDYKKKQKAKEAEKKITEMIKKWRILHVLWLWKKKMSSDQALFFFTYFSCI